MRINKRISFFVIAFFCTTLFAQPGQLQIIENSYSDISLLNEEQKFSFYCFGKNPAGILTYYKNPWLRAATSTNFQNGGFRRALDPESQFQLNFFVEGLKKMHDRKSVFYGYIQYATEDLINVYRGLEYEPYHDIFTAIDTTKGTFDYYGPNLAVEYGREIFPFLAFGARVHYRIRDGLKREPSKTKITGRLISADIGAIANLPFSAKLGVVFSPFSDLYRLNANKQFLPSYPVIYKYFGDSLLVKNDRVSVYNRKIDDSGYRLNIHASLPIGKSFIFLANRGSFLEYREISENASEGRLDIDDYGSWQKTGRFIECLLNWKPFNYPFRLEMSYAADKWNSWARTPRYQTLFEEMSGDSRILGSGFMLGFRTFPLTMTFNFYHHNFCEQKKNYYQNYQWKRKIQVSRIKSHLKFKINENFALQMGITTGKNVPEYHLSMREVNFTQISGGLNIFVNNIIFDIMGTYQKITPLNKNIKRQRFFFLFQITQLL